MCLATGPVKTLFPFFDRVFFVSRSLHITIEAFLNFLLLPGQRKQSTAHTILAFIPIISPRRN